MGAEEREVFALFCREQYPSLVGVLTLYVGHRADAEDYAQEALARTWRDWDRIRTREAAPAYAHRTALNLAKNQFRRAAVRRRYAHLVAVEDQHVDPDGADAMVVRDAIRRLPPRRRAAVVLRYFGGLTVAETADVLGVPPNTVKTLTRRGLHQLRDDIGEVRDEENAHA